jgi:hypothetical protein
MHEVESTRDDDLLADPQLGSDDAFGRLVRSRQGGGGQQADPPPATRVSNAALVIAGLEQALRTGRDGHPLEGIDVRPAGIADAG